MTKPILPLAIVTLILALAACVSPSGAPSRGPDGAPPLPDGQSPIVNPWAKDSPGGPGGGGPSGRPPGPPRFDDLTFEVSDITVRVQPQPISKVIRRPDFPAKLFAYRDIHSLHPRSLRGPPIRWPIEDVQVSGNRVTFRAVRPGSVYVVVSWEGVDLEAPKGSVSEFKVTVTQP